MRSDDRFEELKQMSQDQLEAVYTERWEVEPAPGTSLIREILRWEFPGENLLFVDMGEPESFDIPKFRLIPRPTDLPT
jgi:hypothetical protein